MQIFFGGFLSPEHAESVKIILHYSRAYHYAGIILKRVEEDDLGVCPLFCIKELIGGHLDYQE